jgi:hypothetical protein
VRLLALLLAVSLASACEHSGKILTYGAEDMPPPSPNPRDLIPGNTPPAPELSGNRRITEVDCSKPVDMTAGNLRCK